MKVPVRVVLVAAWVSVAPNRFAESGIDKDLEALIDQNTCSMRQIRETLIAKDKGMQNQLILTPKQKEELQHSLQKLKRKSVDVAKPAMESIEDINTKLGVLDELFQGDIIPSSEQLKQFAVNNNENRSKRQAYRNETHPGTWKHGLKYAFDDKLSKRAKNAFRKAARLWAINTCIELKEEVSKETREDSGEQDLQQDGEAAEDYGDYSDEEDYEVTLGGGENDDDEIVAVGEEEEITIFVSSIKGCSSSLGRTPYYRKRDEHKQVLSLARECETISIAAHEIGHALGFYHTHSRHDRDEFLTVVADNINRNYSDQFEKQTSKTNDNYGLTYDYGSIMQYGATTGALVKGSLTMVPKDVLYTQTLGSPMISFYDLLMMNMHYNCTAKCKGRPTECNYGFPHPRNCSRCICPSGYGGQFCDRRPGGCSQEFYATTNWTLFTNDPHNMTSGSQDGYKKCIYWVSAPNGTKVEVKIVELPDGIAVDGCIYGGVEIKTHTDQRRTGYRLCSKDDVNTTLTSNLTTVPIMTYMRRRRNDTDIVLGYRYVAADGIKE